jgi:hypothetical protein
MLPLQIGRIVSCQHLVGTRENPRSSSYKAPPSVRLRGSASDSAGAGFMLGSTAKTLADSTASSAVEQVRKSPSSPPSTDATITFILDPKSYAARERTVTIIAQ